jgi:hypothetical protein
LAASDYILMGGQKLGLKSHQTKKNPLYLLHSGPNLT